MASIPLKTEEQWRELRRRHVGASEAASLFDASPYKSAFQLWHEKKGLIPEDDSGDKVRKLCGVHLEAGAAKVISALTGARIRKVRRYISSDYVKGMGASLDYEMLVPGDGWVPMDIKCVDYLVWRDDWQAEEGAELPHDRVIYDVEPPLQIDIQIQHQIDITDAPFGFVGLLVGGNKPYLIHRPRVVPICAELRTRIQRFWEAIDANEPPPISAPADLRVVASLYRDVLDEEIDLSDDRTFLELVNRQHAAAKLKKHWSDTADALKAQILLRLGGHARARLADGWSINCPTIVRKERHVPAHTEPENHYRGALYVKPPKAARKEKAA